MNDRIRFARLAARAAAVALATLLLAPVGLAQGRADADVQEDVVYAVSPGSMTITLGDVVYRVSDKTRLFDAEGRRISLSEVTLDSMVEFTAKPAEQNRPPRLRRLQVREGDFE
ncbi:MAG: hypothetical protein NXI30_11070 [bacterium]|nr:hypothetical protein [bacterium]